MVEKTPAVQAMISAALSDPKAFLDALYKDAAEERDYVSLFGLKKGKPFWGGKLTQREAAEQLGCSTKTLLRMRQDGTGPKFRYHGLRVCYSVRDLDAWLLAKGQEPPEAAVMEE